MESQALSLSIVSIAILNVERKTVAAKAAFPPTNFSQFFSVKISRYLLHAASSLFSADFI